MFQFFQKLQNPDAKFHVHDSFYRIKKLEKVCQKEDLALLIINGIDSKENFEYIKLMNWAFLGFSGVECVTNEYLDVALGETMFLILKDEIRVFADHSGFKALKPYLIGVPNVQIYSTTEKQEENKDECELVKITHFVRMMQGVKKVGVLLPQEKNRHIEKWPIIQSYALLENGFFTMQYEIVDMTERINQLYKPHDKHSLKTLIHVISQRLHGHAAGALSQLIQLPIKKRSAVTSDQLLEIFLDSMEIEGNTLISRSGPLNRPSVCFGPHQQGVSLEKGRVSEGIPCLHLTMEGVDLYSSLRFARSYFMTKQVKFEHKIVSVMSDENFITGYAYEKVEIGYYMDEQFLSEIYKAMIVSLQDSLLMICQDYRKMGENYIGDLVGNNIKIVYDQFKQQYQIDNLKIMIKGYNAFGEEVVINLKDGISFKLTPQFFVLRLEQTNIISVSDGKSLLGSLVLGDSFILQENCFYIITKSIPYIQVINCDVRFSDGIENLKKRLILSELGQELSDKCDKNRIFFPQQNKLLEIPIYEASCQLHQFGLRLHIQELGWMVVLFNQMKKIQIIQGMDHIWIIFQCSSILLTTQKFSRIALEFNGKAVELVYMKLLDLFQEQSINFIYIENPKEFTSTRQGQIILKKHTEINLNGNEITNSAFLLDYLESKQLIILTQVKSDLKILNYLSLQEQEKQLQQDTRVGLILITGAYSSGKTKFAQNLAKYGQDFQNKCQLLEWTLLEQSQLDEEGYINKLRSQLQHCQDLCICVVPFYLNCDLITQEIGRGKLSQNAYIRCVVNKINLNNIYENEHHQIINNLIAQCSPGYCQYVILDTFGNNEEQVEEYHKILRSICAKTTLYRITNNMIQQSVAADILKDVSYNYSNQIFLRNKMNIFRQNRIITYDKFFIPNDVPHQKTIRKILKEIVKPSQKALPKLNDLEELQRRVKTMLQSQQYKIYYIKGYSRCEDQLDRLYEYTVNENYVIEKQLKSLNIVMKEQIVNGKSMQIPSYPQWQAKQNIGFFFVGVGLDKQICATLVESLSIQKTPFEKYLVPEDLSKEIIKQLEFENRGKGLENGEFYDGQFIRDQDGEIMPHHPKLNEFIHQYLEIQNALIKQKNDQIQSEWKQYIDALELKFI